MEEKRESVLSLYALYILAQHADVVKSVAWSPDGSRLASGSGDNTVRLWDRHTGELMQTLEGHTAIVYSVAWSPDGSRLASGSGDNTVRLWDGHTGELVQTLEGHTAIVYSVAWSPDGSRLASGSGDNTVRLWDGHTGELMQTLKGHTAIVYSVAWSPDGSWLASGSSDNTVRLWDGHTGELVQTLEGHTNTVQGVAWSPDGSRLVSGSYDNTVRLWDGHTGKLVQTLEGHTAIVYSVAWSPDGSWLASGSYDNTVRLWDGHTGELMQTLKGHTDAVQSAAWSPDGSWLASGNGDNTVRLWDGHTGELMQTLEGHTDAVQSVAWSPDGNRLASGSGDNTVRLWDGHTGKLVQTLEGHTAIVYSVAWSPDGSRLVSGSDDSTVRLWDRHTGELVQTLEGHTAIVYSVAWSPDGNRLASGSGDNTVRLWDGHTGELVQTLEGHTDAVQSVAWSPDGHIFVSQADDHIIRLWHSDSWDVIDIVEGIDAKYSWDTLRFLKNPSLLLTLDKANTALHIWTVNADSFTSMQSSASSVRYTTAKIALVGDSSVGKSGLGYRLAEHRFQITESTHGQQFWILEELARTRTDGTQCEVILWDFAGQPNFRPIHALFLEDIDLALILFDPARLDTLTDVDYWLKHLGNRQQFCPMILVAARIDVSGLSLSPTEIVSFCQEKGIGGGFVVTSAKSNEGIENLLYIVQQQIDWDAKPSTITTQTFKRVKDYVLQIKEGIEETRIVVSYEQLYQQLQTSDPAWSLRLEEMKAAIQHLQNHGYVTILRRSSTEDVVLLAPDVLINLAASYMLKAQAHEKGLGALDEVCVLRGDYHFQEVERLSGEEPSILLNAVTELFLSRNICFRESIDGQTFLIFPSLISERPPRMVNDASLVEDLTYVITGRVENVYPTLVVLLGYSPSFQRTYQWRRQAQYETQNGYICSFKLIKDSAGELELVLYYGKDTPDFARMRFQGLFEQILITRALTIKKYPLVFCPACGFQQRRRTVIDRIQEGKTFVFCEEDGEKIVLLRAVDVMSSFIQRRSEVINDETASRRRTTYETALVRVKGFIRDRGDTTAPTCFVSYAWDVSEHERWVLELANDLRNAGIHIVLDWLDNATIGSNVARFISRVQEDPFDFILLVGTPLYFLKYQNKLSHVGSIVAAEVDLINARLIGTEAQKASVLPLLLEGETHTSFPTLVQHRVYGDFRKEEMYFSTLFDLLLTLLHVSFDHPIVQDLRAKLRGEAETDSKRAKKVSENIL